LRSLRLYEVILSHLRRVEYSTRRFVVLNGENMGFWNWLTGSKDKKKAAKTLEDLTKKIADLSNPESNPAQNYLTQEAIQGAEYFKKGDYSSVPKGMFFNFQSPVDQMKQFDNYSNVGKEGNYALADNEGMGNAISLAGDYRKNLFARDASQNFQNNIAGASDTIRGALGQASGAKGATDASTINALQGLYQLQPKGNGALPGLAKAGFSIAKNFI
jgi:hypothetical protein